MKIALYTLVSVLLLLGGRTWAESPVSIPDAGLKAAIEDALYISDPTPTDMLSLTHLEAQAHNISSLSGLESALNLQSLSLRFNHVGDVSPLAGLSNLSSLHLNDNEVCDVSPLGGLTSLHTLDLHDNKISDISALSGLVNVTSLALRQNPLSDISPLAGMANLAELSLLETRVSDISALANLKALRYVDLRDCPLNDDAYDVYIPQMQANNPGMEIETDPYRGRLLTLSSTFGGYVAEPGEGEFVYPFDTLVHLKAQADPGFVFDHWSGPFPITTAAADIYTERSYEFRAHFRSLRDTLYVDSRAAADLGADGSPERPIPTIQDAIEVASQGVTIVVYRGVYRENVDLQGKKIHLKAVDPDNPDGGPCATIEGTGGKPVVTIGSGCGAECSLSGFVITRGRGGIVSAIDCSGAAPRLSNCLIVGNRCSDPNGAIAKFRESQAVLIQCTFADNYAGENGAGLTLVDSDVTITNSIFWNNRPSEIVSRGAGHPVIRYCCVRGWWPDFYNIFSDPLLARPGYWADPADPAKTLARDNPQAVWVDGDYHVKSQAGRWDPTACCWVYDDATSPAIDTGDPASSIGRESSPNGGIANMGAYGGTAEASRSLGGVAGAQGSTSQQQP
ncbi:MAG: leucine-rich repeat domain-containing protein [Phycisphaerales bacterium]